MRAKDRVAISWCDPGQVDGAFASSLVTLTAARSSRLAEVIRIRGGGLLSRTRNEMVKAFLDRTQTAWLLMLDSDQTISPDVFDLLVESAHDTAAPVVAGLCFGAWETGGPYPMPLPNLFDLIDGSYTPISEIEPRTLRRVDGAGTGCLLIHRDVLQGMRDDAPMGLRDWCWFADGPTGDGRWLSEDLTFCKRLGERGVPIHAHTGAVLPHRKWHWETDATYDYWKAAGDG